jgi:hypothetical protein
MSIPAWPLLNPRDMYVSDTDGIIIPPQKEAAWADAATSESATAARDEYRTRIAQHTMEKQNV